MTMRIDAGNFVCPSNLLILKIMGRRENLYAPRRLIGGMVYDSSLNNLRACTANIMFARQYYDQTDRRREIGYQYTEPGEVQTIYTSMMNGYEKIYHAAFVFKSRRECLLIGETDQDIYDALYSQLMNKSTLPLLKEWMPYVYEQCVRNEYITDTVEVLTTTPDLKFSFEGRVYRLGKLNARWSDISEAVLENIISEGLRCGAISITPNGERMAPLLLSDLDTYTRMYGDSFVANLKNEVKPLMQLKGGVEESLLSGNKRLWKQQGAAVNGVVKAFETGKRAVMFIEGMGCGKTVQGLAVEETYQVKKWLNKNPGKMVRDAYADENNVKYRTIVMPPGHLVMKWAGEAEENIPFVKAKVLNEFSDIVDIYLNGKERKGKEVFVIGKDFAKLSCAKRPVPYRVRTKPRVKYMCPGCGKTYKPGFGEKTCQCGMKKRFFKVMPDHSLGKVRGLICEACGQVLTVGRGEPLLPSDFAEETAANRKCLLCGSPQWQPNVVPLGTPRKESPWHKISHFTNKKKNARKSVWVLKGHESDYLMSVVCTEDVRDAQEILYRKWAPAQFIKTKLKGFFDLAVFDELHMYKGGGTAQGQAMLALSKSAERVIGLTGTIAGGYASDLFYTLWRLAPRDMVEKGYTYDGVMDFVAKYGTIETRFQAIGNGTYNSCSKGRQISSPTVKPGISPLIFQDFLIDKAVFLDLTDMSNHLPKLCEQVVPVPMEPGVEMEYRNCIATLKSRLSGQPKLMPSILQYSLAYPDKPYGYDRIIDPDSGDIVYEPDSFPEEHIYPKEEKLIDILNAELDDGRNCFVYCEYTGGGCQDVTKRLSEVIRKYCGLEEKEVMIIRSESPSAVNREAWIHKQAAKGVRVFICNPQIVETGLDFIFKYEGESYNYPTIVFYQLGVKLFTLWQASRRAYRLNQTEECHTYYLCYENTNQAKVVRLMAEKQIATAAIQGHFSMEGLAAMSQSVDPRIALMNNLMVTRSDDAEKATDIFQNINTATGIDESVYGPSETLLFKEVFDVTDSAEEGILAEIKEITEDKKDTVRVSMEKIDETSLFGSFFSEIVSVGSLFTDAEIKVNVTQARKKLRTDESQMSLFDLI